MYITPGKSVFRSVPVAVSAVVPLIVFLFNPVDFDELESPFDVVLDPFI